MTDLDENREAVKALRKKMDENRKQLWLWRTKVFRTLRVLAHKQDLTAEQKVVWFDKLMAEVKERYPFG